MEVPVGEGTGVWGGSSRGVGAGVWGGSSRGGGGGGLGWKFPLGTGRGFGVDRKIVGVETCETSRCDQLGVPGVCVAGNGMEPWKLVLPGTRTLREAKKREATPTHDYSRHVQQKSRTMEESLRTGVRHVTSDTSRDNAAVTDVR